MSSIEQTSRALSEGRLTALAVVDDVLTRASAHEALNAFISVFHDQARHDAQQHSPDDSRPLAGIPISVKDDLFTAGLRTTGGSTLLRDFVPSDDCPAVARLREAGAIVFAKTNLSDFAMSLEPGSTLGGVCRNPWDPSRTAGASSSGAASAIAAGVAGVAIATDSGGSIRYPAALCGAVGFAPSNGRVPRHGSFGANHFFCAVGVIARDVRDVAGVLGVMSGPHASDPETWQHPYRIRSTIDVGASTQRVGVLQPRLAADVRGQKVDALFSDGVRRLALKLSWQLQNVQLRKLDEAGASFRVISDSDRLALMTRAGTLGLVQEAKLPPLLRARFEHARTLSGSQYSEALALRDEFRTALNETFSSLNLLIGLTYPTIAPKLNEVDVPPLDLAWTNLAGCPAASIPLGLVDGMPIGLHLVARPGHDVELLRACLAVQNELAPEGFSTAPGA